VPSSCDSLILRSHACKQSQTNAIFGPSAPQFMHITQLLSISNVLKSSEIFGNLDSLSNDEPQNGQGFKLVLLIHLHYMWNKDLPELGQYNKNTSSVP
jgi:hypothetical protein